MKIGLLGGTFDPIHHGHLAIAECALHALSLDHIEFIPCYQPPHRHHTIASATDRLAMVTLAIQHHARLKANPTEIKRRGISYTIDTLIALCKKNPSANYYYILGSDAFASFQTWKNWQAILKHAQLIVVLRDPSHILNTPDNVTTLSMKPVLVSATEIRKKIQLGEKNIVGLEKSVERYIVQHKLYQHL